MRCDRHVHVQYVLSWRVKKIWWRRDRFRNGNQEREEGSLPVGAQIPNRRRFVDPKWEKGGLRVARVGPVTGIEHVVPVTF